MAPSLGPTALIAPAATARRPARESFSVVVSDNLRSFPSIWPRTNSPSPAEYHVFQCADVLEVWCNSIGTARGTKPQFIAVFDRLGRPVMLLPLGIERRHGLRVLTFLDGGVCDYNAPIIFPEGTKFDRSAVADFWNDIRKALPSFDVAIFDKMPMKVGAIPNPLLVLGAQAEPPSAHIATLSGTWTEFSAARFPLKRRNDSLRRRRRLADLGRVEFVIASTAAERRKLLDAMIRQKGQRYLKTIGINWFDDSSFRNYFIDLTERSDGNGPVHLSALEVDGKAVATHWGLVVRNHFYHLMPSYEDDWSRFAPGRLLLEHLIEWSFENGIEIFDFGIGDEPYKLEYRDLALTLHRALVPVTPAGYAFKAAMLAKRGLRHKFKDTRAWGVLKRLRARASGGGGPPS